IMVAVALIVGFRPFHGSPLAPQRSMHEPPLALWLGPAVLAIAGVVAGLFPWVVDRPLIGAAVSAISGEWAAVELKLWHGLNPGFWLSAFTGAAGVGLYLARHQLRRLAARLGPLARFGPESGYRLGLRGLLAVAAGQTRLLQHGYLRGYVVTLLA